MPAPPPLPDLVLDPIVRLALTEDLGRAGDLTTDAVNLRTLINEVGNNATSLRSQSDQAWDHLRAKTVEHDQAINDVKAAFDKAVLEMKQQMGSSRPNDQNRWKLEHRLA